MALDLTKAVDRIRITVGDINDLQYFPDSVYQQILDANNQNEKQSALQAAQYILGMLSGSGFRERAAQYEVYGREAVQSYMDFLNAFITGKNSQMVGTAGMYAGGISVQDVNDNILNTDNVLVDLPTLGENTSMFDSRWWY